jgi:transposase-like protein
VPDTARGKFAPGSTVAAVARQYEVATSVTYKWRRTVRARETDFAEVVVVLMSLSPLQTGRRGSAMDARLWPAAELMGRGLQKSD